MAFDPASYDFDRFLRYDDMVAWLDLIAARRPDLVTLESYGHSYEGRKLWVLAITDQSTGSHDTKPAHWVDANIHAVEVTGGVAALYLVHHLVNGFESGDPMVTEALRTRTFYVAPRVNPDGVEAALADRPLFHRASVRAGPGPTAIAGRVCTPKTSTVTGASSPCAYPIRTEPGSSIPTTRG